jgi:Fic family protein
VLAGYGAVIDALRLPVPLPRDLSLISAKRRQYHVAGWRVFTPRHAPADTLWAHLVFALKYEGLDLLFFKQLFSQLPAHTVEEWVRHTPQSRYARTLWFLYEWLLGQRLALPDLTQGNYVLVVNEQRQYAAAEGLPVSRQRLRNNLPGVASFCPLVHKSAKLEQYLARDLAGRAQHVFRGLPADVRVRTSAFLLLKDSKASFTIEGEQPALTRALRWGRAIGQAGQHPLSREELLRLQQLVIENSRFVRLGYRTEGGFVGEHDRQTGNPIPDHVSARWQDLDSLVSGLLDAAAYLETVSYPPVLTAAAVAFGFVFVHPFVDGNGRVHRYLIHHLLARLGFTPPGIIFPVSAAILEHLPTYRQVLEGYSHAVLEFIPWQKTADNNVEVLADTSDYYRYFDATPQAEFLFDCVAHALEKTIPEEVAYLQRYDALKAWLDERFQMPDKLVAMLVRFLEQHQGVLSKRAREKEFALLTSEEADQIQQQYALHFPEQATPR